VETRGRGRGEGRRRGPRAKKAGEAAAEAALVQAEALRTLIGKIDVVHTLVNSRMTSAM
jgi:hypothetical protein